MPFFIMKSSCAPQEEHANLLTGYFLGGSMCSTSAYSSSRMHIRNIRSRSAAVGVGSAKTFFLHSACEAANCASLGTGSFEGMTWFLCNQNTLGVLPHAIPETANAKPSKILFMIDLSAKETEEKRLVWTIRKIALLKQALRDLKTKREKLETELSDAEETLQSLRERGF